MRVGGAEVIAYFLGKEDDELLAAFMQDVRDWIGGSRKGLMVCFTEEVWGYRSKGLGG